MALDCTARNPKGCTIEMRPERRSTLRLEGEITMKKSGLAATITILAVTALVALLFSVEQATAKEQFKNEGVRTVVVHQKTGEKEVLKGIGTKEKLKQCPPRILAQIAEELARDGEMLPPNPQCFKFDAISVLLQEVPGMCTGGTHEGYECSSDEDSDACTAGGGECEPAGQCDCHGYCRDSAGTISEKVSGPAADVTACVNATVAACAAAGEVYSNATCIPY
jgi:hypothetical protein